MSDRKPSLLSGGIRRSTIVAMAVIVALAVFFFLVRDILLPFAVAAIVAYVCTPLVDWLTRKSGWPRWTMAVTVLAGLVGIAALVGFVAGPPAFRQIARIAGDLQGSIETFTRQLIGDQKFTLMGNPIDAAGIAQYAENTIRSWLSDSNRVFDLAALGAASAFAFLLSWVLLGYFLIDAPHVEQSLFWLIPPQQRRFVHRVWTDLNPVLRRYFIGVVFVVLYATAAAYVGLGFFLGLRHALVLAVMTGLLEIIPIVGPISSGVIAGLVAVQQAHGTGDIIAYVIYAVALRISIDEFFAPIVLGKAAYVRPVLVIFCFLSGGILFGIVGIVLAIPVALTVKAMLAELYKEPEAMTD